MRNEWKIVFKDTKMKHGPWLSIKNLKNHFGNYFNYRHFSEWIWDLKTSKMEFIGLLHHNPARIYLHKVNNSNTRSELCSKLTIKTLERLNYVVLVKLTSKIFYIFFYIVFFCWFWTSKCLLEKRSISDVIQILKIRPLFLIGYLESAS